MELFDTPRPQRKGSQGRIADSRMDKYQRYENHKYSCPPDIYARLEKFCQDEERAKSWVIQKALDVWLQDRGY